MRMTLNDLECPIHLKVRFTDGTLDVRTLWLSDSAIRIGIARGAGRSNPTLPPCGQLTRCFSAVAELLVDAVSAIVIVPMADRHVGQSNSELMSLSCSLLVKKSLLYLISACQ